MSSIGDLTPEAQRVAALVKILTAKSARLTTLTEQYDRLLMGNGEGSAAMQMTVQLAYGAFTHVIDRKKDEIYSTLLQDILECIKDVRRDISSISGQLNGDDK